MPRFKGHLALEIFPFPLLASYRINLFATILLSSPLGVFQRRLQHCLLLIPSRLIPIDITCFHLAIFVFFDDVFVVGGLLLSCSGS